MNFLSAVLTILSSFLITFLLMPSLIKYFRAKKEGQQIRNNFVGCCLARIDYEYAVGTSLCPGCLWPNWDVG